MPDQSLKKIHQFQQELLEHHMDICGITETWIKQDDIEATTRGDCTIWIQNTIVTKINWPTRRWNSTGLS